MKTVLPLVALLSCGIAEASVYRLDLNKVSAEDREMVQETCIREIRIDASRSVDAQILAQVVSKRIAVEKIQNSKTTLTSSEIDAYSGEIQTGVYLVKRDGYGSYLPYIAERVEINRYATALNIRIELLNHRDSAELAEESVCGNLHYLNATEAR